MKSFRSKPLWFQILCVLGLAWNIFGLFQFAQSVGANEQSLMSMGLTQQQAEVMANYPLWMTLGFAVGTFGGTIGCVLLISGNRFAQSVFSLSLAGYIVLYIGDITEGIFEALGMQQVAILTTVVLIAAGLLYMARYSETRLTNQKELA